MILQILGVIFLIVICVVGYYAWKIYRYVKSNSDSDLSKAVSVLPQTDMELEPSDVKEWKEKERLEYLQSELKKVGAEHLGYYRVYAGSAIIKTSLWNFKSQAVAIVYEAATEFDEKNVSFFFEVASKLNSGSICITSNQHASLDSRPTNHKIVFNKSNSILDFIRAIKPAIPSGSKLLKIADPKEFFLECYEDTTEWSWRSEQLHSDKTQQIFSSVGVNVTEELMEELVEMGESYAVEVNVGRTRRSLQKNTKMSVEQWEKIRDKLVIVNEKMHVDHLIEAIYDLAGELSEVQEQVLDGFENNTDSLDDPIGAFQMLLQSMNIKAKRITKTETPVRTEVYLPL